LSVIKRLNSSNYLLENSPRWCAREAVRVTNSFKFLPELLPSYSEPNWFVTASVGQSSAKAEKPNVAEVDTVSWDGSDTSYSIGGYHYRLC